MSSRLRIVASKLEFLSHFPILATETILKSNLLTKERSGQLRTYQSIKMASAQIMEIFKNLFLLFKLKTVIL